MFVFSAVSVPGQSNDRIALLDSAQASNFFAVHYPECGAKAKDGNGNEVTTHYLGYREYERYFRGWQWMLDYIEYDFDIIHDQDLTTDGLAGYKVLVLSNDPVFSDDQTRAIHKWVLMGGRLLATFGTSYKDTIFDRREIDKLKLQKGGTFGLHQLWHDPVGKLFSTLWVDPGVDVKITRYEGPTGPLAGTLPGDILEYGAEANILIQRPEQHPHVFGQLVIDNREWKSTSPAIISTRQARGLVVYLAFAPEYIVYKELESRGLLPEGFPSCPDGQSWADRGRQPMSLMVAALDYLLSN
jgi:hypothetical protein